MRGRREDTLTKRTQRARKRRINRVRRQSARETAACGAITHPVIPGGRLPHKVIAGNVPGSFPGAVAV